MTSTTPQASRDESRVWLITGASSGFGKRFVLSALSRGDRVIATARSLEKLESFTSTLDPSFVDSIRNLQLDLTDGEAAIREKIGHAFTFWNQIDVLVNNAGYGVGGVMEEGGSKLLRRQFDTNVFGVLDITTATLPYLRKSAHGCVVTIGSRSAWKAELPGLGFYAASKAAIHAVTESFMSELAQFNIKVLLVEPGSFKTEGIYSQSFFTENPIPQYDHLRKVGQERSETVGPGGLEKGDPHKAVEAVIDVVKGEGVANGRPWPSYLILGNDAAEDVKAKCEKVLTTLSAWSDVAGAVY